jgi:hypothetical protein
MELLCPSCALPLEAIHPTITTPDGTAYHAPLLQPARMAAVLAPA